jgi:hypothetical protein
MNHSTDPAAEGEHLNEPGGDFEEGFTELIEDEEGSPEPRVVWDESEDAPLPSLEFAASATTGDTEPTAQADDSDQPPRTPPARTSRQEQDANSDAWDRHWSAARLGHELNLVETEVRQLLEGKDPKRKRKFTGTRRWQELEEDIVASYYNERMDITTIQNLNQLIARRHAMFRRLQFLAGTRPTWNS